MKYIILYGISFPESVKYKVPDLNFSFLTSIPKLAEYFVKCDILVNENNHIQIDWIIRVDWINVYIN